MRRTSTRTLTVRGLQVAALIIAAFAVMTVLGAFLRGDYSALQWFRGGLAGLLVWLIVRDNTTRKPGVNRSATNE